MYFENDEGLRSKWTDIDLFAWCATPVTAISARIFFFSGFLSLFLSACGGTRKHFLVSWRERDVSGQASIGFTDQFKVTEIRLFFFSSNIDRISRILCLCIFSKFNIWKFNVIVTSFFAKIMKR